MLDQRYGRGAQGRLAKSIGSIRRGSRRNAASGAFAKYQRFNVRRNRKPRRGGRPTCGNADERGGPHRQAIQDGRVLSVFARTGSRESGFGGDRWLETRVYRQFADGGP